MTNSTGNMDRQAVSAKERIKETGGDQNVKKSEEVKEP